MLATQSTQFFESQGMDIDYDDFINFNNSCGAAQHAHHRTAPFFVFSHLNPVPSLLLCLTYGRLLPTASTATDTGRGVGLSWINIFLARNGFILGHK